MTKRELAARIDHTILKQDASREQIRQLCGEAVRYGFASVCINPCHVPLAVELLEGTGVPVCTVVGFPLGANRTGVKVFETETAVAQGAREIDMVVNVGALKERDADFVREEIRAVVAAAGGKALVKVILETCLLTDGEKVLGARLCMEAGADFVKTSTGFSTGGATPDDVALLHETVAPALSVKASGGIRTTRDALEMIARGADRIGASASVSIVEGLDE
ncbi:deoxyribose-phosphate aldolase [Anaerotalea alkaliphila]|uniref:Deoxyribose-phosphate aldolase n=1 Tax=Anaerotalea alkaliphila TaxID=2662126 RepID=A0A7X5HY52_9FIRM|nr:deoxyribose-phosphate aldolase [Anaerotalea alkaliphila]NDL68666.1 deoxyribose-phosphate aldolase [Anaerotalea alkaliphila]